VHALQFRLLGKFAVYYNHTALDSFNVQKVQELLCYLLVHRDRPHHREVLAELLWNNANTPYSKKYLRKTLWQLQTALIQSRRGIKRLKQILQSFVNIFNRCT